MIKFITHSRDEEKNIFMNLNSKHGLNKLLFLFHIIYL